MLLGLLPRRHQVIETISQFYEFEAKGAIFYLHLRFLALAVVKRIFPINAIALVKRTSKRDVLSIDSTFNFPQPLVAKDCTRILF